MAKSDFICKNCGEVISFSIFSTPVRYKCPEHGIICKDCVDKEKVFSQSLFAEAYENLEKEYFLELFKNCRTEDGKSICNVNVPIKIVAAFFVVIVSYTF